MRSAISQTASRAICWPRLRRSRNSRCPGLPQPITLAALTSAVTDAAHYDAFDLVDAALDGEARRVRHIVWVLRAEGVAVLAVLGSLTVQLRRFLQR